MLCLDPSAFSFVCFIHDLIVERNLLVADKCRKLRLQKRNKGLGSLPGHVKVVKELLAAVFYHFI